MAMGVADFDDPSCISFSENIDESPNRKISSGVVGAERVSSDEK